jgi:predicted nucleic acid-binding protein
MTTVVDASVVVKWFVDEPGSDEALAVLEAAQVILAPDLIVPEVGNAAWKKVLREEIERAHAERILRALGGLFDRLVPSVSLVSRALEIAIELQHPVYDALYLALAEAEGARLVTDDGRLLLRVAETAWQQRVHPLRTAR